ncbi:inositol monophosphatase family protein [Parvularcula dongshanensis]|uniref:Myo-inositol-1(Or 4)-monophosphatase n=1 Tax=Parvularcula dongshanensis TaxID=1173995 RepID=A0A840I4E0_9PROT|nr:inositol monophosphatase [Parvularcula dongshanensis]MBB4659038.1 myo-inositol-1(or 4)-monophosphatase [Parvularcula dongshanensis]
MTKPTEDDLARIEAAAADLARLAGAEAQAAFGRVVRVAYKDEDPVAAGFKDPVSEVDQDVERLVRARLAEDFPEHDVIGEEMDERPGRGHDFVWAIDPIDGTTNFVNAFPMFSSTIGVLHRGEPVAGAVWCSTSHALRPGVYSAHRGGRLRFDGEPYAPPKNPGVKRRLIGAPDALFGREGLPGDLRKTGSAAIECAFVAAGLLSAARFQPLNLWDVAGGVCLAQAAGIEVRADTGQGMAPFERFEPMARGGAAPDLRFWRGGLILGPPGGLA